MLGMFKLRRRTQESRAWTLAARHGDRVLLLRVVRDWRTSVVEEIIEASDVAERGEVFFENALMKTHLRAWIRFVAPRRAKTALAEVKADELWRKKTRDVLFRRWRDNVWRIAWRRAKMAELFLFLVPLEFHNSSFQRPKVVSAETFHRRRLLRKSWEAFVSLNAELADLRRRFKVNNSCGGHPKLCSHETFLQEA